MLEILTPGLLTTVQDLGRPGWRAAGVPVGGACDALAATIANWLVGNDANAALLETTLTGLTLRVHADTLVAVTGAVCRVRINDDEAAPGQPLRLRAGDRLYLGPARAGCRNYVAVQGGLDIAPVLGSAATCLAAGFGGWQGRPLRVGDRLPVVTAPLRLPKQSQGWSVRTPLPIHRHGRLRLLPGPDWASLTPASQQQFLSQACYTVTARSDRMGLRFEGPTLERDTATECSSEPVAFGTVQLPPDGQPILLLADAQTTGGYPRITQLASIDQALAGQLRPGDHVRFEAITLAEADRALRQDQAQLNRLRLALRAKWEGTWRST